MDRDREDKIISVLMIFLAVVVAFLAASYPVPPTYSTAYAPHVAMMDSPIACDLCEFVVAVVTYEDQVANKTINEISTIVEEMCAVLAKNDPPVLRECDYLVQSIDQILWEVTREFLPPPDICEKLHLCG